MRSIEIHRLTALVPYTSIYDVASKKFTIITMDHYFVRHDVSLSISRLDSILHHGSARTEVSSVGHCDPLICLLARDQLDASTPLDRNFGVIT